MRLAIDVREAGTAIRTGKGQWTFGFVSELLRRDYEVVLFTDGPVPSEWGSFNRSNVSVERISGSGIRWHWNAARFLRRSTNVDCYVSPTSYIVPALLGRSFPCIPIVHDLIAFRSDPHDWKARWIERLTLGRAVRGAAHVCTVSNATKVDLLARYPSLSPAKITAIDAGPMMESPPPATPDGTTILCIATLCPRKNQERLIRAFASLPETTRAGFHLLLVGARGWNDAPIVQLAANTPGVEWRPYVDDAEYQRLLGTCTVFALPSLYEGFGMQILDAMQRGIPVLTSDRGSLREVAGDAACIVDPENETSIAQGLSRLLTNGLERVELSKKALLQAKKYSWKRTVDLFLQSLEAR